VKMEIAGFPETLVIIYKTARSHIPVENGLLRQSPKSDEYREVYVSLTDNFGGS
jgi:hypothetical protein